MVTVDFLVDKLINIKKMKLQADPINNLKRDAIHTPVNQEHSSWYGRRVFDLKLHGTCRTFHLGFHFQDLFHGDIIWPLL